MHINERQIVDNILEGDTPEEWSVMLSDQMHDKEAVLVAQEAWNATRPAGDPMFGSAEHNSTHVEQLVHVVKSVNSKGHSGVENLHNFEAKVKEILKRKSDEKIAAAMHAPVELAPAPEFVDGEIIKDGDLQSDGVADRPKQGKLPEDFPGFSSLQAADVTTYAQARKVEDFTTIPGIGKVIAAKIREALGEEPEASDAVN